MVTNKRHEIPDGFVKVAHELCFVCLKEYPAGLLLHKHLKEVPDEATRPHSFGLCDACKAQLETHIAMIGAIAPEGNPETVKGTQAVRTGEYLWVSQEHWAKIFDGDPPPNNIAFLEDSALKDIVHRLNLTAEGDE